MNPEKQPTSEKKVSPEDAPIDIEETGEDASFEASADVVMAVQEEIANNEDVSPEQREMVKMEAEVLSEGLKESKGGKKRGNRVLAYALAGLLTFLAVSSARNAQGAEKTGSGTRIEQSAKPLTEADYANAWKILEAHGVKQTPESKRSQKFGEAIGPGSRAMIIRGEAMTVAAALSTKLNSSAANVSFLKGKIERNSWLPEAVPGFEGAVAELRKQMKGAEEFAQSLKDFFPEDSPFKKTALDLSRQWLNEAEEMLKVLLDPNNKEKLEKKRKAKISYERLNEKRKKGAYGLDSREQKQWEEDERVLDEPLSPTKQQSGSEGPQKLDNERPSTPGTELDDVPAKLKRAGEGLRESTDKINKLMEQMKELNKK